MKFWISMSLKLKRVIDSIKNLHIFRTLYKDKLNVAAKWFTLLVRIQEIPGLSLGLGTGSPDGGFS
jgi:hypothetical protein